MHDAFARDLAEVINRHSVENVSDTPDIVLAAFLVECLDAFDAAVNARTALAAQPDEQPQEFECEVCTKPITAYPCALCEHEPDPWNKCGRPCAEMHTYGPGQCELASQRAGQPTVEQDGDSAADRVRKTANRRLADGYKTADYDDEDVMAVLDNREQWRNLALSRGAKRAEQDGDVRAVPTFPEDKRGRYLDSEGIGAGAEGSQLITWGGDVDQIEVHAPYRNRVFMALGMTGLDPYKSVETCPQVRLTLTDEHAQQLADGIYAALDARDAKAADQ